MVFKTGAGAYFFLGGYVYPVASYLSPGFILFGVGLWHSLFLRVVCTAAASFISLALAVPVPVPA